MNEIEIWKDIPGFEGHYQASSLGRVRSLDKLVKYKRKFPTMMQHKYGKILKQSKGYGADYVFVTLQKFGKAKPENVHRIIGLTFIPNPENKKYINHKNGIKSDNRKDNLEWVTAKENIAHAFSTGLIKPAKGKDSKLYNKGKRIIDTNTDIVYGSIAQASRDTKIHVMSISGAINGHRKKHNNFKIL